MHTNHVILYSPLNPKADVNKKEELSAVSLKWQVLPVPGTTDWLYLTLPSSCWLKTSKVNPKGKIYEEKPDIRLLSEEQVNK